MELKMYLRTYIHNLIRPIYIKNQCEICQSENDLHLHHVKLFSEIVNETLNDLNLEYKNTEDYTRTTLHIIRDIVLGKHLQIDYLTLCDNCHKDIHAHEKAIMCANDKHKQYFENRRIEKEIAKKLYVDNVLIPYLDTILGKKLFNDDQQKISDLITNEVLSLTDYRTKKVKPSTLETIIIMQLGLPYTVSKVKVESKGKMRGKRYIIISN